MTDRQPWRCEGCRAILGWITAKRRLELYGQLTVIHSGDVTCGHCGRMRIFYPADGGMQELLSKIAEFRDWLNSLEVG